MSYVVFDIGGTKTRVAVSKDLTKLDEVKVIKTAADFKTGMADIEKIVKEICPKKPDGFAGGVRGILDEDKSGIEADSILADWAGRSIADELHKISDVPVLIENDSAMAGLGEAVYGAGKGMDIVAYHTVSTGVGGVKIENGMIDVSSMGFEPGHQILDIDRTVLGEDIQPTLENLVSGTALGRRFGVPAFEIPQDDVVWEELAGYLAQGLRNTVMYWSPEAIVLGGAMIVGDPCISIEAIRKSTVEVLDGFVECPFITKAALGDDAGLYGGLAVLSQSKGDSN
tara:strand:+ start:2904 stop:3755 length:852 start_codon:yes stop_codon:yes gene_type:complete